MAENNLCKRNHHHVDRVLKSKSPSDLIHLLTIDVASLTCRFGVESPESDAIRVAIAHRSKNQSWKLWQCPRCSPTKIFPQRRHLSHHLLIDHEPHSLLLNASTSSLTLNEVSRDTLNALLAQNWELTADNSQEKSNLVQAICSALHNLASRSVLAGSHIDMMFKIAKVPSCRSLEVSKLREVLKFLEGLSSECCEMEEASGYKENEEVERVTLNADASKLVLNPEQFSKQPECVPDVDILISWLFDDEGRSSMNVAHYWSKLENDMKRQADEIIVEIKEEVRLLEATYTEKCDCLRYRRALETLEKYCIREVSNTKQSHDTVLRTLRNELAVRAEADDLVLRYTVSSVLKETESLKVSKMRNLVKLREDCTMETLRKQIREKDLEEAKLDARLLQKRNDIRLLETKLEYACALDYLAVVEPLIKCFLQQQLEDEVQPDDNAGEDANKIF